MNKRKILYISLLASCLVHGIVIYCVSRNHLDFLGSSEMKEEVVKIREGAPIDLNCEVFFNDLAWSSNEKKLTTSNPTLEKSSLIFVPQFDPVKALPYHQPKTFLAGEIKDTLASVSYNENAFHFPQVDLEKTFFQIKEKLQTLKEFFPKTLDTIKKGLTGKQEKISIALDATDALNRSYQTPTKIVFPIDEKTLHLDLQAYSQAELTPPEIPLNFLSSLKKLHGVSMQNLFDVQISRDQNEEGLFAITLIPKNEIAQLKKVRQNYLFVVDRSHSIDKRRFDQARHAVLSSLSQIGKNNRFNVVTFSRDISFLSDEWLSLSSKSLKDARAFLSEQGPSGMLSSTNLFPLLQFLRSHSQGSKELITIILLTDGKMLSRSKNSHLMEQWTRTNPYQVSFYTCAIQGDKNLALLDFFASRNRGSVVLATSERGMKRQLYKIVKKVSEPIATEVSLFAKVKDDQNRVFLFPSCHRIFPLYAEEPLVIIGKVSEGLKDFDLFVQGRNGKDWLTLKKEINFAQAKEETESLLSKEWALYRSHLCYERYYREKNPSFLGSARSILRPFGLPVAIE